MMTRFTEADIIVVGLIGERGREVKEFIEHILGEEGLKRSVVVASPADDAPLMRLRAAMYCTRIAEYFRDKGKNVLLLMDSLTRFAQAQREIALAIGEPPATKGYPPSVFAKLPKLVERAGNAEKGGGSITAFYTVLSEGDDQQDPIADSARGVLDGHIVLSRRLAEEGHYPAIDIEASISRVMPSVVSPEHMTRAQYFKQLWSRYQQSRDLISVGAYVAGGDRETDLAISLQPQLVKYLRQGLNDSISLGESEAYLAFDLRARGRRLTGHGPESGSAPGPRGGNGRKGRENRGPAPGALSGAGPSGRKQTRRPRSLSSRLSGAMDRARQQRRFGPMAAGLSRLPRATGHGHRPAATKPGLASEQPEQGAGNLAAGVCPGRRLAQAGAALHG